jgi:AcrR family transcriptional regulator
MCSASRSGGASGTKAVGPPCRNATYDPPGVGLRERKTRTRALIKAQALRLFRAQGYEGTSIEEIAGAAEVSPSTVFRYFPTKPDLVIYDDLDERMSAAFRAQPAELNAVQALRASVRLGFGSVADEELASQYERGQLLRTVPDLRAAMLGEFVRSTREIIELVAERSGRSTDDDAVQSLAGAVMGLLIAAWFANDDGDWVARLLERVDAGMAMLESGFRF